MKPKSKVMDSDKKRRNQNEHPQARRKIWLRVAAIFVAIAFLASECATLLPIE